MNVPVTVVILNWNGKTWLEKFLPSVMATHYSDMEILLVDNASTDDSVAFIQKTYPEIRLLVLDKNYGFAEGNNKALPHIHTPYFVLLNSDVEVDSDWLAPMVRRIESDPKIASIQPKVRSFHQKTHFEYAGAAGGLIDKFAYPFCRGRIFDTAEKDEGQYEQATEIFWATGACCLIRKKVVDQLGLFRPEFFAHMEEIDFCWRAKNAGYKIYYEPKSVVYHVGGGALAQGSPRKTFLNARNSLVCMFINLPSGSRLYKVFVRMLLDGVWSFKALLSWDWPTIGAILKAHLHFYASLRYWARKRKQTYTQFSPKQLQTGYFGQSIVWKYFIQQKKTYLKLDE